ncbi:MAG TPA: cache domain-containing protein [Anaerolineae bacterium]|nr:HAMP domain-containing protein [Anaerolineae bacterium]HRV93881.1 cache domain-containing protein [Anaerolineae bacterium]
MKTLFQTIGLERLYTGVQNWLSELRSQALVLTLALIVVMTVLAVSVVFFAFRQVSQTLAESRDQELANVGAERVSEQMESLLRALLVLVDQPEMQTGDAAIQDLVIRERGRELLIDFTDRDGGIIVLDNQGTVKVTRPFRPDLINQDFSQEPYFRAVVESDSFTFSDIITEPTTGQNVVVISVPIVRPSTNEFVGAIAVRFYIDFQRLGQEVQKLKVGEQGVAYLVDRNGRLIYHPIDSLIGLDFSQREAVKQLQAGNREGAITSQAEDGASIVEGYAVVPLTGWGLVIGEPWSQAVSPALTSLTPVAIILIIGLIVVASMVSLGVQRVTDPIQNLVTQTRQVATGDYDAQVSLSRIKEIKELGTAFNEMVQQIGKYRAGIRQYVADITNSQEEERKRIARDLHDDTVQTLIAIGQRIELIKGFADNPTEVRSRLSDLRTMVTTAITSVRQFSRDLRPLTLEDLGLAAAMQYLVNQLEQNDGIEVTLEIQGEVADIPNDMEIAIYRILQEALNNVRKHAHATKVSVLARFTPRQIRLSVRDNGRGFDVPDDITDFTSSGNFGLMGLQERAQLFGGSIKIKSYPNQGTIMEMTIPRQSLPPQIPLLDTPPNNNATEPAKPMMIDTMQ